MKNQSFITVPYELERPPPPFGDLAIKYPEALVRHFLKLYTKRGDKVFDPFAGLGTTLFMAEEMGRVPFGLEHDAGRQEWVAGQLKHWTNLRRGDARKLTAQKFPKMDFCMTSPPFMGRGDRWNPLTGGDAGAAGYATYLRQMKKIFAQIAGVMKRGGPVVVQLDNIPGRVFTPLVWDAGRAIADVLTLEAEIIVAWKNPPPDYPHTHCLLFRKR